MLLHESLRRKADERLAAAQKIREKALSEDRLLSDEEKAEITKLSAEAAEFEAQAVEAEAAHKQRQGYATGTGRPGTGCGDISNPKQRAEDDGARGFRTPREFLSAVAALSKGERVDDSIRERITPLAFESDGAGFMLPSAFAPRRFTAGSDEQGVYSDPYGGFLVPQTSQLAGVREVMWEGDPTSGLVTRVPMTAREVELIARVDKDHSSSVTGGFTVSRTAETQTVAATRSTYEKVRLRADKLMGIAYASSEVLRESPASFAAIIDAGMRTQFASQVFDEKIRGTGVGEYLGILNSPAVIEVTKETNQTADTIVYQNLVKMRSRIYGKGGRPVWMIISDALEQLMQLVNPAGQLIWQADATTGPSGRILGFPIVEAEECSALGDVGDIMLVNMAEYLEGLYQPIEAASSVHVRFLNDETAYRFTVYNAGAPWWRSALTPKHGQTKSPIVTLGAR